MGNFLQKIIYNLSITSIAIVIYVLCKFVNNTAVSNINVFLCVISLLIVFIFIIQINIYSCKTMTTTISIKTIRPVSAISPMQFISYITSASPIFLNSENLPFVVAIFAMVLFFSAFTTPTTPNPILFLLGYKFYQADAEHGVGGYLIISKRTISSPKQIKVVHQLFDYTLITKENCKCLIIVH